LAVITVGIDVASQPAGTAGCWIEWSAKGGTIQDVRRNLDDESVAAILKEEADKTGLDVPLGWPDAFVRAVSRHHAGRPWGTHPEKKVLELRATDLEVRRLVGWYPLSVSTNWIAFPAMRMARILGPVDRTGAGPVVEVYPAAALAIWGLPFKGYKGDEGRAIRHGMVSTLRSRTKSWLTAPSDFWALCENSDHVVDALVASLVARASALGLCHGIPERLVRLAQREGWIALPVDSSLDGLRGGRR
jgi:predicted nuclease with RNAse H fold